MQDLDQVFTSIQRLALLDQIQDILYLGQTINQKLELRIKSDQGTIIKIAVKLLLHKKLAKVEYLYLDKVETKDTMEQIL